CRSVSKCLNGSSSTIGIDISCTTSCFFVLLGENPQQNIVSVLAVPPYSIQMPGHFTPQKHVGSSNMESSKPWVPYPETSTNFVLKAIGSFLIWHSVVLIGCSACCANRGADMTQRENATKLKIHMIAKYTRGSC